MKKRSKRIEREIEKLTFKEWYDMVVVDTVNKPLSALEIDVLYQGYWSYCQYHMCFCESKEKVRRDNNVAL